MDQPLQRIRQGLAAQYAVERELGRGGAATVYLAQDLRHSRPVAIKVLHAELSSSISTERFRREIAIAASLTHPHIVAVFDSGRVDDLLYYVMPYIAGQTLRDELDRTGPLPIERALRVASDVGEGLAYAHAAGVVHRDVKPRNILLSSGHALIADFGIARVVQQATAGELTLDGSVVGTPAYMSPEQAAGEEMDSRSDVYALGCVVFEMLAGEPPFRARSAQGLVNLHMTQPPPSLSERRADVNEGLSAAVCRALAKAPNDRFDSIAEFIDHLDVAKPFGGGSSFGRQLLHRFQRLPALVRLLIPLSAVAGVTAAAALMSPSGPSWAGDRPESIVVLPHHMSSSTDEERLLTSDIAAAITSEIDAWETIRAVPHIALSGPMFDLGIEGPTIGRVDDALRLARSFGVHGFLAVTARLRGDSVFVEATLFDAGSGRAVGRPFRQRAVRQSPAPARMIAAAIMGVANLVGDAPVPPTSNPDALRAEARGRMLLERWQLAAAAERFRAAIALDSAFALAHHRLAQTLYWQTAVGSASSDGITGEITFHSAAALRHGSALSGRDSLHVRAFYAFQDEDYANARQMYDTLVARDPNDVYAWLTLGSIEYLDPWLNGSDPATARPRADYSRAIHAFTEALQLQPTFELGYGYLFSIYRQLMVAADQLACPVFHLPTGGRFAPSDARRLGQVRQFCPVRTDSIVWLTREAFDSLDAGVAVAGAEALFLESMELLRRWVAHSPDQPMPARELARQILAQRQRLSIAPPHTIDSLTNEALTLTRRALQFSGDTLPIDLVRLGVLYLGVDSATRALDLVEQGLALWALRGNSGDSSFAEAANVFVATGRPGRALPYAARRDRSRAVPDPLTGRMISYGGAEPVIERLRVFGATQSGKAAIQAELLRLDELWSPPRYTAHEARVLRRDAALRIAPALLLDTAALTRWNLDLGLDEPLWQAMLLVAIDPARTRITLQRSRSTRTPGVSEASRAFLHGAIAARLGDHDAAVADFTRIDSIPLGLENLDVNWGLRATARLLRAESWMALDSTRLALDDFESFIRAWQGADSLAAPLVEYARGRAAILRDSR